MTTTEMITRAEGTINALRGLPISVREQIERAYHKSVTLAVLTAEGLAAPTDSGFKRIQALERALDNAINDISGGE